MADHSAFIHTVPGLIPVRKAVCSCGWESNPYVTALAAIQERSEHYRVMAIRERQDTALDRAKLAADLLRGPVTE